MKNRYMAFALGILLSSTVLAGKKNNMDFMLDKVAFSLTAKKWVKTDTARLQVNVNATLSNTNLMRMRQDIVKNLNTIAKGSWQITQFKRSQDNSGLEKLYVSAEARVNQSLLTNVNNIATKVSKPGVKYNVENIDFTPSLAEVEAVKRSVREMLYSQANDEINNLNKQYPNQKYTLNQLVVLPEGATNIRPQLKRMQLENTMMAMVATPQISVSNEVKLSAVVSVASNRDEDD